MRLALSIVALAIATFSARGAHAQDGGVPDGAAADAAVPEAPPGGEVPNAEVLEPVPPPPSEAPAAPPDEEPPPPPPAPTSPFRAGTYQQRPPEPPATPAAIAWPVAYALRPITLRQGMGRLDAYLSISRVQGMFSDETYISFQGGFGMGVTDDLELGSEIFPLAIAPQPLFLDPSIYGRARILRGTVELATELRAYLPVRDSFTLAPSILVLVHAGPAVRIDSGVTFGLVFDDPVQTSLSIPIVLTFQGSRAFFLGLQSGVDVSRFERAYIPLGAFLGGTIVGDDDQADADLRFGILLPSVTDGTDVLTVTLGSAIYFR